MTMHLLYKEQIERERARKERTRRLEELARAQAHEKSSKKARIQELERQVDGLHDEVDRLNREIRRLKRDDRDTRKPDWPKRRPSRPLDDIHPLPDVRPWDIGPPHPWDTSPNIPWDVSPPPYSPLNPHRDDFGRPIILC